MTDTTAVEGDHVAEARRALRCLRLEVHPDIAYDIERRVELAFTALAAQPSAGAQGEAVAWQIQGDDGRWHNYEPLNEAQKNAALSPENPWRMRALGIIATPAQPDTGDVAALREAIDPSDMEIIEAWIDDGEPSHCVPYGRIKSLWQSVRAALSKPNAPGGAEDGGADGGIIIASGHTGDGVTKGGQDSLSKAEAARRAEGTG